MNHSAREATPWGQLTSALVLLAALAIFANSDRAHGQYVATQLDRLQAPFNLDFESGDLGDPPAGWSLSSPEPESYRAELSDRDPRSGERYGVVYSSGSYYPTTASLSQTFDAVPFRGRVVAFRVWLKAAIWPSDAHPTLQIVAADGTVRHTRTWTTGAEIDGWEPWTMLAEVHPDAVAIQIAVFMSGRGRVRIDAASFETVADAGSDRQLPAPLSGRALDNLVALTRLVGYVRYFHPSDEAANAGWNRFSVAAIRAVEAAADEGELARRLEEIFAPLAPTLRVYPSGSEIARLDAADPPRGMATVEWRHEGVAGASKLSRYSSRRIHRAPPSPTGLSQTLSAWLSAFGFGSTARPSPGTRFVTDLAGGVAISMPLVLPTTEEGTVPAAEGQPIETASDWLATAGDRSTRLAAVALTWNVFQHFYPYFDEVDVDWPAALRRALSRAAVDNGEEDFIATLRALVAELEDGHGLVTGPSPDPYHHPSIRWAWIGDELVVTDVAGAATGSVEAGDRVLEIDGRPLEDLVALLEPGISASTPHRRRYRLAEELANGHAGSTLELELERVGGGRRRAALVRSSPPWKGELEAARPPSIRELEPRTWYVDLRRVDRERYVQALPELTAAAGIVFDLRGFPNKIRLRDVFAHLIETPVTSPQWNVPIARSPDRIDVELDRSDWQISPRAPRLKAPVVFLTDERAVSTAETFLAIVERYHLAEIAGGPTAGTNGNVNYFALPGDYRVQWTGMKVLRQDGSRQHGVGIQPTIPVEPTRAGVAAGRDEVLERAVSWLQARAGGG